MASKKAPSPAMEFLLASLKDDKKAVYADLKAKADEKKLKVFPIMFGRAQALLGIVKSAKRGQGKAKTAARAKAGKSGGKTGRKPDGSSKSGQVRELLASGMSVADIAKKVGCTTALVYNVKSASGKMRTAKKRGPGRPRKAAGSGRVTGVEGLVAAIKDSESERARMLAALERVQAVIADALG